MIQREISDKRYQMDALDGLRGFAALMVVFSHTSNSKMFLLPALDMRGTGKPAVFLFFLLSAFLLSLPLLKQGYGVLTFRAMSHYWQRRFFRIYPLYTLYLLLGLVSSAIFFTYLGKSNVGVPFALDLGGFVQHMLLQEGKGVTWSIAVEFKFYFALPFIVLAAFAARPLGLWAPVTLLLGLLLLSQVLSPQSESAVNDTRVLPYMPIFLLGVLLAVLQDANNRGQLHLTDNLALRLLGYVGVLGILLMSPSVYSVLAGHVENDHFHRQFVLYGFLWSFVLMSAVNVNGLVQRVFAWPGLRFFGALSFSLYLFHPIVIRVLKTLHIDTPVNAWIVVLASTLAAYISFAVLEGPVSRFKLRRTHFGLRPNSETGK